MTSQRGFTIVELVLVMILVGILAVSAWQRAPSDTQLTIRARAEQLASDIRYVQTLSMTRGQRYCITVTNIAYTLNTTAANACTATQEPHPGALVQPIAVCRSACMTFTNFAGTLVFDGLGIPYTDATTALANEAIITITEDGISRTVTVTRKTGHVVVQ